MALEDQIVIAQEAADRRPDGWEAIISKAPADVNEMAMVTIAGFDEDGLHEFGPCPWPRRGTDLPLPGDRCLVAFDDSGDPWVTSWWSGYFPDTTDIATQTELDAEETTRVAEDLDIRDDFTAGDVAAKARANHTGTQLAATVSDFDSAVRLNRLDQLAAPAADVSFGGYKATLLASPAADKDAVSREYAWGGFHPGRHSSALVACTMDPMLATQEVAIVNDNRLQASRLWVPRAATLATMEIYVTTAGAGLTVDRCYGSIYDASNNLIASTADQSAVWNATGRKNMALTGALAVTPGYYVCVLQMANSGGGAVDPGFVGLTYLHASIPNMGVTGTRVGFADTHTSPPAILPALTNSAKAIYIGLRE